VNAVRPPSKIIAMMTDFGLEDPYVAAMKGVILSICRDATIVDITHEVRSFDIEHGAFILWGCYRYFPPGTVFLVVVDPGVGSARRGIAIATHNYYFVGPDNGVLMLAAEEDGIEIAVSIDTPLTKLHPVSKSFHGRDVFAPTAAWICNGLPLTVIGREIDISTLVRPRISMSMELLERGCARLRVVHIDKFGNVILSARYSELARVLQLSPGTVVKVFAKDREFSAVVREVFSHARPGELVLYEDSYWLAELAVNLGSAKELLNVDRGDEVVICRV